MKNRRIVFLGTHGQMNIGDELLLETFLTQLGPENQYYVNSYDPVFTERQLGAKFQAEVFHTGKERSRLLRHLQGCDLLFFGGGSIIKELYASVGRHPYSTLLMVLGVVTYARHVVHKPIVMSNIGVGPLRTAGGKQLASRILRQVTILSVRDRRSYNTCLELGMAPNEVLLVPDAVFANPPTVFLETPALPVAPAARDKLKIALNLNYDIKNPANWETFQQNLIDGLCALNRERPLELHTLPMQSQFKEMHDARVLAEFRARIPELEVHLHMPENHCAAAAIIDECHILLSERLHALVMAAITGKPFVALMYDVKVNELVAGLDMNAFALDINRPFDPLDLKARVEKVLHNYTEISCHLLQRSTRFRHDLAQYFGSLEDRLSSAKGH